VNLNVLKSIKNYQSSYNQPYSFIEKNKSKPVFIENIARGAIILCNNKELKNYFDFY
jgi:hypothetical protein